MFPNKAIAIREGPKSLPRAQSSSLPVLNSSGDNLHEVDSESRFTFGSFRTVRAKPARSLSTQIEKGLFILFPYFPREIRLRIWKSSMEPRIITIIADRWEAMEVHSTRQVPAIIQVCWESRTYGLRFYEKLYSGKSPKQDRYVDWNNDIIYTFPLKFFITRGGINAGSVKNHINQKCVKLAISTQDLDTFIERFSANLHLYSLTQLVVVRDLSHGDNLTLTDIPKWSTDLPYVREIKEKLLQLQAQNTFLKNALVMDIGSDEDGRGEKNGRDDTEGRVVS